jgi:hypothetical protein
LLDSSTFPHIIHNVFRHVVDTQTRSALRATSRQWRKEVDQDRARHIMLWNGEVRTVEGGINLADRPELFDHANGVLDLNLQPCRLPYPCFSAWQCRCLQQALRQVERLFPSQPTLEVVRVFASRLEESEPLKTSIKAAVTLYDVQPPQHAGQTAHIHSGPIGSDVVLLLLRCSPPLWPLYDSTYAAAPHRPTKHEPQYHFIFRPASDALPPATWGAFLGAFQEQVFTELARRLFRVPHKELRIIGHEQWPSTYLSPWPPLSLPRSSHLGTPQEDVPAKCRRAFRSWILQLGQSHLSQYDTDALLKLQTTAQYKEWWLKHVGKYSWHLVEE